MSDFILVYERPGCDVIQSEKCFLRACRYLAHGVINVATRHDGPLWSARVATDNTIASPLLAENGSWIATHGLLSIGGKQATSASLVVLRSEIDADAVAAARSLDGVFTVIAWSETRRRLVVIPSALGMCPVFHRELAGGLVCISSSIAALASLSPVSLDKFSFQAMFRCGHRLPPHTLFNGIHSISEGSLVALDKSGMSVLPFWQPRFGQQISSRFADSAREISHHMEEYCTSLIEQTHPVFSDLTGGYDSRVSTGALVHAGIPFIATVAGSSTHPDVTAAKKIAAAEGFPLVVVDPMSEAETMRSRIDDSILLAEGSVDVFSFASTLHVKRTLFRKAASPLVVTVSGALGECYRDFYWSQEFLDRGKRQQLSIDRLVRYRIDSAPGRMDIFARDWREDWRDSLRTYVSGVVKPYSGERNTSQIDAVYLRKMAGMIGGFAGAVSRLSAPLIPFGSLAALNVALSVPPRWRFDARLLRQVAYNFSPSLANHMTLSGRPCAPLSLGNWYRFAPKYWLDARRIFRKFSSVWLGRTWFPEYMEPAPTTHPYSELIQTECRPGGVLDLDSMHSADCYNPRAVRDLLRAAAGPDSQALWNIVSKIYTCEAMLRLSAVHQPTDRVAAAGVIVQ